MSFQVGRVAEMPLSHAVSDKVEAAYRGGDAVGQVAPADGGVGNLFDKAVYS